MAALRAYLDGLVHPIAAADPTKAARHRAFIATRLFPGLLALSALPLYFALIGVPGPIEATTFVWLIAPIAIAFYLARTGRYERAHILSAIALTGVVFVVAALSGGLTSFAVIWFALIPAEAVLSRSRQIVIAAGALATAAVLSLAAAGAAGWLPTPYPAPIGTELAAFLSAVSATAYAFGLAVSAAIVARADDAALSAGDARYRLLAEHMTDLVTLHEGHGQVVFASPAAERLVGASPSSLNGRGLFDRVHVADRPAYLNALSLASSRAEETSAEFRLRIAEGSGVDQRFAWVEMRCRPVAEMVGAAGQVVAVLRDVSERKLQEAAVETARAEADRANEARSRFLANVTHELRTPLNAINGFSEMLMHEEAMRLDAARRKEYAHLIHDSGEHLLNIVNSILDMSKIESGHFEITPEPFALDALALQCAQIMQLKADEADVALVADLPSKACEIVGDKRACRQILLNLLSNALKFTRAGGRVTVSLRMDGGQAILSVADTGVGISEADLPRVGSPFFQSRSSYDRPYEGTGLGLSVVKGLAELHGGRVDIASTLGKGTRVTVRLPVDCETSSAVVERVAKLQPPSTATPAPLARGAETEERKSA